MGRILGFLSEGNPGNPSRICGGKTPGNLSGQDSEGIHDGFQLEPQVGGDSHQGDYRYQGG